MSLDRNIANDLRIRTGSLDNAPDIDRISRSAVVPDGRGRDSYMRSRVARGSLPFVSRQALAHFPANRMPVRVEKKRHDKEVELILDSSGSESARAARRRALPGRRFRPVAIVSKSIGVEEMRQRGPCLFGISRSSERNSMIYNHYKQGIA
jgi:hypothetical protein